MIRTYAVAVNLVMSMSAPTIHTHPTEDSAKGNITYY